ncbi:MAG: hypothetical protein ETSY2_50930 [Candidatus Entotheonella gemina]|uniref:Uncharacterized protein n=1 Tax=Candidatus Entotheonella gemina TaxID=1429439 RepID=W4L727_9BACT|nr:MAG: hypothetical protein ETSY2_50930 [Candidatus Entotheonella gemina]
MAFSLNDAISHYRSITDTTHKFWGYFQAVAAGTAAFAWLRDAKSTALFVLHTIAFVVFAFLNGRLVVGSQKREHSLILTLPVVVVDSV